MTQSEKNMDALLNLAIPVTLEDEVADFLLLRPALASGFTIIAAQGMGQGANLLSSMEQVQGRCKRKLFLVVGEQEKLRQLLKELSLEIKSQDISYWITPVLQFGRLS